MTYVKYPRTLHLPWSSWQNDDRVAKHDSHFYDNEVVVTVKMDGENTSMYEDKLHARSIDSSFHESRSWVKGLWGSLQHTLGSSLRVCGENVYAKHTIEYNSLDTYFYGFSVWNQDTNIAYDWDTTLEFFKLLDITPVIEIYRGVYNATSIHVAYVNYKHKQASQGQSVEGYVVRLASEFHYDDFPTSVNKFVEKKFKVALDESNKHWMTAQVVPNKLKARE